MEIYKREFGRMGGYLTDCGKIDLQRTESMFQALGKLEDGILRSRMVCAPLTVLPSQNTADQNINSSAS